ncbi:MAG: hypothetical protein WAU52_14885 [Burkholderiales bacterium]
MTRLDYEKANRPKPPTERERVEAVARDTTGYCWVNKRSGVAHLYRDCEYIAEVPDGALRMVQRGALARLRCCPSCLRRVAPAHAAG